MIPIKNVEPDFMINNRIENMENAHLSILFCANLLSCYSRNTRRST